MNKWRLRQLAGYARSGAARVLAIVSQLLLISCIGRFLSAESTGVYASCFSLASIVAILLAMGQSAAVIREMPDKIHKNLAADAHSIASRSLLIVCISGILFLVPVVWVGAAITDSIELGLLSYGMAFGLSLLTVLGSVARCHRLIFFSETIKAFYWRAGCVILLSLSAWQVIDVEVSGLLLAAVILMVVSIVASVWLLQALHGVKLFLLGYKKYVDGLKVDISSCLLQLLQAMMLNVDVLLVGVLLGYREAGIYFVIARIAALIALPLSITNPVIFPKIGRLLKSGGDAALSQSIWRNAVLNIFAAIFVGAVLYLFKGKIFSIMHPSAMTSEIGLAFSILVAAQFVNVSVGPTSFSTQLMDVREKSTAVLVVCLLGMIGSLVVLANLYGLVGSVVAVAVWRIIQNLWTLNIIRVSGGLNLLTGRYEPPI